VRGLRSRKKSCIRYQCPDIHLHIGTMHGNIGTIGNATDDATINVTQVSQLTTVQRLELFDIANAIQEQMPQLSSEHRADVVEHLASIKEELRASQPRPSRLRSILNAIGDATLTGAGIAAKTAIGAAVKTGIGILVSGSP
jgi:hypothetical protein